MAAYHRPETLDAALELLARGPATIAAGCTDLFPATSARALEGEVLDITGIEALKGISRGPDGFRIGAATTWAEVITADLPSAFDALKEAAREVGSVQIQSTGTIAGNLCNASPAADGVPCLLTLEADVELASLRGVRTLPLAEFITGLRQTSLEAGEMVTAIVIPAAATGGTSRFLKLGARRYLVISIAMVAVRLEVSDGRIVKAAISVGACSAVATRLPNLEAALVGCPVGPEAVGRATDDLIAPALSAIGDIRADAAYRMEAAAELVRRAIADLMVAEGLAA